ncbi:MAG: Rieske 2Fe-2S domain-containing protein [Candidatus Bathyarchaeia archaeon]|jgi:nitrite reductase/ring-hydroxylating ferredoxin subunit
MPAVKVCSKSDVASGSLKLVSAGGKDLVVANVDGNFYVMDNWCTHEQGNISEGELNKKVLTCPEHGAQFDVTTGKVLGGPDGGPADSILPETAYKVRVQGNDIMVDMP